MPVRVPRALRESGRRVGVLGGFIPLVRRRASPRRPRTAHTVRCAHRTRSHHPAGAAKRPHRRLGAASRSLRPETAHPSRASDRGVEYPPPLPPQHRSFIRSMSQTHRQVPAGPATSGRTRCWSASSRGSRSSGVIAVSAPRVMGRGRTASTTSSASTTWSDGTPHSATSAHLRSNGLQWKGRQSQ